MYFASGYVVTDIALKIHSVIKMKKSKKDKS